MSVNNYTREWVEAVQIRMAERLEIDSLPPTPIVQTSPSPSYTVQKTSTKREFDDHMDNGITAPIGTKDKMRQEDHSGKDKPQGLETSMYMS